MRIALNIGCGNKLIKSNQETLVLNIDTVAPPGMPESVTLVDAFDEIEKLPRDKPLFLYDDAVLLKWLPNDSADEIHAYHLIEHFHPYQVQGILNRWRDVLKPGGTLALEQPDVIRCAINLLQMYTTNDGFVSFNLGLLGFYGAQDPKQPLMSHKYGWTARTLTPVLIGSGFINIEEFPAQTHAGPKRDFRLEGEKPTNE